MAAQPRVTFSEQVVDSALGGLAAVDPGAAQAARAAFEAVTGGEGLTVVTGHAVADFLWYQLPTKWLCDLDEKLFIAAALGELFTRLDMPRYSAMCTDDSTAEIITGYEQRGRAAGLKAYRAALAASGLQPPDLPGVLVWGSVMGTEEAAAYWSASAALEMAVAAGTLRPGTPGWRRTAARFTAGCLGSVHDDTTGTTWLQWVHTERLQRFADSRGPARARLAEPLADQLVHPVPVPADAEQVLAPMRWLLDHTAAGAALTTTGNLARPLVAEGCRLFGWLTTTGSPRSESDIVELSTLRDWARQMGVVRRSGQRLVLSTKGSEGWALPAESREKLRQHLEQLQRDGMNLVVDEFTDVGFQGIGIDAGGWFNFRARGHVSDGDSGRGVGGKGAADCATGRLKAIVLG